MNSTYLKKRILVRDVGGVGFQTADIRWYLEALKPGPSPRAGPEDVSETGSGRIPGFTLLEVLVVMALMATVLLSIPPVLRWTAIQGAGHAARALQGELQLARCMAIGRARACSIVFNHPMADQYTNSLSGKRCSLDRYHHGVHFLPVGPDGKKMAAGVNFDRQGMSMSIVPADVYIAGDNDPHPYRIRVLLPGGISVCRWDGRSWR